MSKDPNEKLFESIEKAKFWGVSSEDEMRRYVASENQRQREAGKIEDGIEDKIDLSATVEPELKRGHKLFTAAAIVAGVVVLITAIAVCLNP